MSYAEGSVAALCARYVAENPAIRGSQRSVLTRLQGEPIGALIAAKATAKDFIEHCKRRQAGGTGAATVGHMHRGLP